DGRADGRALRGIWRRHLPGRVRARPVGDAEPDHRVHGEPGERVKHPRLWAAAAAILLSVGGLGAAALYVRRIEERYVHSVAAQMFAQKNQGVALQRAAFRQPDLLPFYGSSDLNVPDRYHASALFRNYPTGFTVFPVGNPGSTSLIWLQALAAV